MAIKIVSSSVNNVVLARQFAEVYSERCEEFNEKFQVEVMMIVIVTSKKTYYTSNINDNERKLEKDVRQMTKFLI